MTDSPEPGGHTIKGKISEVSGQAAIGIDIEQEQTHIEIASAPTAEELQQLKEAFASLKNEVAREAPREVRDEAVHQAEVLERATTASKPDVSAMATAKRWFLAYAPKLVGAVTAVIINPIVGKIVQSAGDAIAAEYRRWFPEAEVPAPPDEPT